MQIQSSNRWPPDPSPPRSPAAYRSMVSQIKATAAAAGMPPGDVRVGANLNWEKVCGCPAGLLYSTR